VSTGTPEEAVAKARLQDAELLDAAEECNSGYPWNEFTVYDESGQELLQVLDGEARLLVAAPDMLEALESVTHLLEGDAQDKALAAIARAKGGAA
jgi:hypothetical protein